MESPSTNPDEEEDVGEEGTDAFTTRPRRGLLATGWPETSWLGKSNFGVDNETNDKELGFTGSCVLMGIIWAVWNTA